MQPPANPRYQVAGRDPRSLRNPMDALVAVDRELAGERAGALGRAGTRLEKALASWYARARGGDLTPEERDEALDEVAAAVYALLVQRDCAGFRCDNLRWIRRYYDVPEAAIRRI